MIPPCVTISSPFFSAATNAWWVFACFCCGRKKTK